MANRQQPARLGRRPEPVRSARMVPSDLDLAVVQAIQALPPMSRVRLLRGAKQP